MYYVLSATPEMNQRKERETVEFPSVSDTHRVSRQCRNEETVDLLLRKDSKEALRRAA